MYDASSDAAIRITFATSCGSPNRLIMPRWPRSIFSASSLVTPRLARASASAGVFMTPGHTQFTRMLNGARSMAIDLDMLTMAALLAL